MNTKGILFSFKGRINRAKFWGYLIIVELIFMFIMSGDLYLFNLTDSATIKDFLEILVLLVFALSIWIHLSLYVKRLHDLDKSGWWALLTFIPVINFFVLLYLGIKKGTEGPNKFGEDPLNNLNF